MVALLEVGARRPLPAHSTAVVDLLADDGGNCRDNMTNTSGKIIEAILAVAINITEMSFTT